jgi:general secretion pathway protein J
MLKQLQYRKTAGFTLLEVLVATVIAAFVTLTALGVMRAVTRSRDQIESHADAASELRYVLGTIERDLTNIYRDPVRENVLLIGEMEPWAGEILSRLTFHTVNRVKARPNEPEGDVYEVEYFVFDRPDGRALMRRLWPHPKPKKEQNPGGVVTVLAENIAGFDVRYYDGTQWTVEWPEDMDRLPDMVDVSLTVALNGRKGVLQNSVAVSFPRWPFARQTAEPAKQTGEQTKQADETEKK